MFIERWETPMNTKQTEKGFTIIEVVLVLAIAGLILLMALVAWPALQSSQRDSARKGDVGAVASAVSTYVSNNKGQWPNSTTLASYATNVSANTTDMTVAARGSSTTVTVADGQVKVVTGAKCGSAGATGTDAVYNISAGTSRQFVVVTRLEASNGSAFCQDS